LGGLSASGILALCACLFGAELLVPARAEDGGATSVRGASSVSIDRTISLEGRARQTVPLGDLKAQHTFSLLVTLGSGQLSPADRLNVELVGSGVDRLRKALHAGDPDLYLPYRPSRDGQATLVFTRDAGSAVKPISARVEWRDLGLPSNDRPAIEAEPNDSWRDANELTLGRDVYGTADDVDYLENADEGKSGLDWFRFTVDGAKPVLVLFQLDLLDRDVSANLKVYTVDAKTGQTAPYLAGKDPMEIVHDRERERYSKAISRTFTPGIYYLEVNANHPDYILRTRVLPVPPYSNPRDAVEAGMHYIINVGDAWFAQIPREGNIYTRASNMHDTATRCTACHPSSFSTEANLVAHRNGYPIRSKSNFRYVIERLYNSITPLYGDEGLYWQRFIAIPLQSQGKQGGILLDFEREVSGRNTTTVERFGPFLASAWKERTSLPGDELNGVLPLDSKFGIAWRDWRVMSDLAGRTGRTDYRDAADRIAAILAERAADKRVETLQDRIHRLHAWSLIDKKKFASKIKREIGALLELQNPDGGWRYSDSGSGPSAVYTTGQLTWTLLRAGLPPENPAVKRALDYLISQQQDFGGWFQTTTDENFRTPMRETRYAVMALAEAYPNAGTPRTGWGNRDGLPARVPRSLSLVHLLDDLENLWEVGMADRPAFSQAIIPLLHHREPLARAAAAAALGRSESPDAVAPLIARLNDPSKIVWRAAAWALRQLGNQGMGVDALEKALDDPDPLIRRGATRVFAYQFHGMDGRSDIADRLIALTGDADLLTRLQALKTLRQWFYRTNERGLKRRIVDAYLARMSGPECAVMRKNLSEGLYIMLDENLGGGVSLQKNIAQLPESSRPKILESRRTLERDVLINPVLTALTRGNDLERAAVLAAFDGSFLKGRQFARRPEGMIDVGNDREFGFLYEPDESALEAVFLPLLTAPLPDSARRQALALASFFQVPARTEKPALEAAILRKLLDPDAAVRSAARAIIAGELNLKGSAGDPAQLDILCQVLDSGADVDRQAVLELIGRDERLVVRPEILRGIRRLMNRSDAAPSLLPVLKWPIIHDAEVLAIVLHAWPRLTPEQRIQGINALLKRPALVDVDEPREQVMDVLRRGVTDPSHEVRDRTLRGINALPALWQGKGSSKLLLSALADDTPSLRQLGLTLADSKPGFWRRPDAVEYLKRLLVDPDPRIRVAALATVEQHALLVSDPGLARRVKSLVADPALKNRALTVMATQGVDPSRIEVDSPLRRPRLPSLAEFRRKVNPVLYQAADDGYSCASCHANHTILRIAESRPGQDFTSEQLTINFNSLLKVVNLGDPEASLVLRKPRSPHGQGGAEAASPTGLTHVGGPRWESVDHPGFKAILDWIRHAQTDSPEPGKVPTLVADSHAPGFEPALAADGDPETLWQTEFVGATPGYPHELVIDLGELKSVDGLLYVPRQDSSEGRVKDFEVKLSADAKSWGEPVAAGRWENDAAYKYLALPNARARFVRLRGLSEVEGRALMSAADVVIDGARADAIAPSLPAGSR
jgi:hypothetical protein